MVIRLGLGIKTVVGFGVNVGVDVFSGEHAKRGNATIEVNNKILIQLKRCLMRNSLVWDEVL